MKSRFTTIDIIAIIKEIRQNFVGHRAIQIYDIDNKTFLIKLSKSGEECKTMLLIESGIRIHITEFEWPKNQSPSGFSMKLRKHIKNKRLESISQIGSDRIIDLQFGTNEFAFHLIIELYDRGNLVLTDHEYMILHLVRPRVDNNQDLKFLVKEKYHLESVKLIDYVGNVDEYLNGIKEAISNAKPSDNIRKILSSIFAYGPNLLEHCAIQQGYSVNMKLSQCLKIESEAELTDKLYKILTNAQQFVNEFEASQTMCGLIFGKFQEDGNNQITVYEEFHPFMFEQLKNKPHKEITSFNQAVDEFFSSIESQKSDLQINQKEKAALKKLENIKLDHERRLKDLKDAQEDDMIKGELIQMNSDLVNRAILILNHAVANQVSWDDIKEMVKNGQEIGDPIALLIQNINFDTNQVTMRLSDIYNTEDEESYVDCAIDMSMNAFSNARKYFSMKKAASCKEQKTISASSKALKSAEVRTKQLLNEVHTVAKINKMRKTNWFEKFNWFISSENYLVVGGKDQQQNEYLVKRYFKPGDIYVHADIHGASTVIIKNHEYPTNLDIPPKTLTEAGHMAVIYSSAWESKISSSAWWVRHDQVSKTAPTGEYLTTGSFMIRGKKNYLLESILMFGFGIMFKIADDSVINHVNDRRVRDVEPDLKPLENPIEEYIELSEDSSDSDSENETNDNFPDTKIRISLSENPQSKSPKSVTTETIKETIKHRHMTTKERNDLKKQRNQAGKSERNPNNNEEKEINENLDKIEITDQIFMENKMKSTSVELEVEEEEEENDDKTNSSSEMSNVKDSKIADSSQSLNGLMSGPLKRGQRNKLKKIKLKYKDQDDEERDMRMAILKGKNPYQNSEDLKPLTKKQKRKELEEQKKKYTEEKKIKQLQFREKQKEMHKYPKNIIENPEDNEGDHLEDHFIESSHQIINTLIGNPIQEDELLYAIPVLAPYQTLQNYKFKVKMIPGNTKRGKAGKSLLFNFIMDRTITSREKDLIKALKDQDITRNFPGKVKIYTPNFTKANKKNGKM